ncbi:MAG: phosphate uptake regulator/tRNA A-37 threonylcarbamoyl transferase component Bud32 [Flavobacterium sp.]|jgi:phosphate uptake regulator/tRNA A-37 threonylcarbamoyl transferase component Bud32
MPIDEGVNTDLQFLVLEVKKQARASQSMVEKPTEKKLERIKVREDYVENLKNTLENKSYYNIHKTVKETRQMNYFRALITITSNLERCGDFFAHIGVQMTHVKRIKSFEPFILKRYYQVIYKALDLIYPALTEHDLDLANRICDYEQELDDYYDVSYELARTKLKQGRNFEDMLTLMNILRYLERAGDCFLNIGEAILDIHVGQKMGIRQFRNLRRGLESQSIDIRADHVEFKPIMNTRSGCHVARITDKNAVDRPRSVFYKEGAKAKIDEEVSGLKLWQDKQPSRVPKILWYDPRRQHSTILLEYIEGQDMLDILISSKTKLHQALEILTEGLTATWKANIKKKRIETNFIDQLGHRWADVSSVHDQLSEDFPNLKSAIENASKIEEKLKSPFATLIHGDFNVDNIIFQLKEEKMYYVDVRRSNFGDYVQDVSVFLISNLRVPIFSKDIRKRLNEANSRVFDCASKFAQENGDQLFEIRMAFGLVRSMITSTRFLFDKKFSSDLIRRAIGILDDVNESGSDLKAFKINPNYFLYK